MMHLVVSFTDQLGRSSIRAFRLVSFDAQAGSGFAEQAILLRHCFEHPNKLGEEEAVFSIGLRWFLKCL
jgi:hypothetical protein